MIYYISTAGHQYTIRGRLQDALQDTEPEDAYTRVKLSSILKLISYERLFEMNSFPVGTYIFSDLERLSPEETEKAAAIWTTLANSEHGIRLLNHPIRTMRRFELLRHLNATGINDFQAYRLTEVISKPRFPLFIRTESDHNEWLSGLIDSPAQLELAIESVANRGLNRDDKLAIEFIDVSGGDGIFHLYGAHVINGAIYPHDLYFSRNARVKKSDLKHVTEDLLDARDDFLRANPHQEQLRQICAMAKVDYGRIDYTIYKGKIQVFEINTNPHAMKLHGLFLAMQGIDHPTVSRKNIKRTVAYKRPWREAKLSAGYWMSRGVHHFLRNAGMVKHERRILDFFRRS